MRLSMILFQGVAFAGFICGYTGPNLQRQDMFGIWKLSHPHSKVPSSQDKQDTSSEGNKEEVVLRLNEDGSFDPYTPIPDETTMSRDDLQSMLGRGGFWEYRDDMLLLAVDRPKSGDPSQDHPDTLFVGKLDVHVSRSISWDAHSVGLTDEDSEVPTADALTAATSLPEDMDVHLSVPKGTIDIGKFVYPKKHTAFFDEPILFKRSSVGTFHMNQILGNWNARLKNEREATPKPEPLFRKQDFHNRSFYLTTAPHPVNPTFAERDVHYDEAKATLDVRVMPITFHSNNTFTAYGTEKILRGRYDITGENGDTLYFRVSLFGFGRSVSGSVYSEGRLLSQDDRRAYRGKIQSYEQNNQTRRFVEGEFYYGYGQDAIRKANSMGTFTLQEVNSDDHANEDDDDEESVVDEDDSTGANFWDEGGSDFQ